MYGVGKDTYRPIKTKLHSPLSVSTYGPPFLVTLVELPTDGGYTLLFYECFSSHVDMTWVLFIRYDYSFSRILT